MGGNRIKPRNVSLIMKVDLRECHLKFSWLLHQTSRQTKTLYSNSKGTHIWEKAMHTCMTNNLIKETNYALPAEYHPS